MQDTDYEDAWLEGEDPAAPEGIKKLRAPVPDAGHDEFAEAFATDEKGESA